MQVAAQTGHSVFLVDVKEEFLGKARASIAASIQRVAKRTFAQDPKVSRHSSILCLIFIRHCTHGSWHN